jgi:ubiquinone/menaquinone biosynthesis C-methylase UbiE
MLEPDCFSKIPTEKKDVAVFLPLDLKTHFESIYQDSAEPWDYTSRGVELLRFDYVVNQVRVLNPSKGPILDVGCSLGQMTHKLVAYANELHAMDISVTAVRGAKKRCAELLGRDQVHFVCASAADLPFRENYFDVVVLSDGLQGWELSLNQKQSALSEAYRVLKPGGHAVLTDYLHPRDFQKHIDFVRTTSFQLKTVDYLCDRIGFQLTNNFRAIKSWPVVKQILSSVPFMKLLAKISYPWRKKASKHLAMILRKP